MTIPYIDLVYQGKYPTLPLNLWLEMPAWESVFEIPSLLLRLIVPVEVFYFALNAFKLQQHNHFV